MGASLGIGRRPSAGTRHPLRTKKRARPRNLLALNNRAKFPSAFVCCVCFVLVAKDAEELSEDALKLLSRGKEM